MDASAHDLLFVGDQAAGLRTPIATADLNPKLSIAIVFKVTPCAASLSLPKAAQPVWSTDDSVDVHAHGTIFSRDWVCDRDAIQAFVKEALCSCDASIVVDPGVVSRWANRCMCFLWNQKQRRRELNKKRSSRLAKECHEPFR